MYTGAAVPAGPGLPERGDTLAGPMTTGQENEMTKAEMIDWIDALLNRADSGRAIEGFSRWAIEAMRIDLADLWPDLDDDQRDGLVEHGAVVEVEADVECTEAQPWQDDWRSDTGGSWPTYTLEITADGMDPMEVQGWHYVGPMGPDGNHQSETWVEQDDDGCMSGRISVDGWEIDHGESMSGGGLTPCWRRGDRWVTLDRESLQDAIDDAARATDHGSEPTWEDVTADDCDVGVDTVWTIREDKITETTLYRGGVAGHDEDDESRRDAWGQPRINTVYWAQAWLADDTIYESRREAERGLREAADDGQLYQSEADAVAAAVAAARKKHGEPAGLRVDEDDGGWYVAAEDDEDGDDPYHLSAAEASAVLRYGWIAITDDVVDALGQRQTLAAARQWQAEMDDIIDADDPMVTVRDSLAAGNCHAETDRFAAGLRQRLGLPADATEAPASAILAVRRDAYTLRACRVAAQRHLMAETH